MLGQWHAALPASQPTNLSLQTSAQPTTSLFAFFFLSPGLLLLVYFLRLLCLAICLQGNGDIQTGILATTPLPTVGEAMVDE